MDDLTLGLSREEWRETIIAIAVVVGTMALALVLATAAGQVVRRITRGRQRHLDNRIAAGLRVPFVLFVLTWALAGAAGSLSYLQAHGSSIRRTAIAVSVLVVAVALRRILVALLDWQIARPGVGGRLHPGSVPLIRRGLTILIFASAFLILLDTLGVAISPLLAGLGIGGLAVALALQPLLANVFASSYMLSDASVRIGDWVEVEGGPAGSIDDIGWRATRIRSFDNNIVVIPNSTLAAATVTNYSLTAMAADARVTIGVDFQEDLERVETVLKDVMHTLRDEWPTAVKDHDSVCSFLSITDANVDILLKMRAHTWIDSLGLRHELIKRVHARLRAEGITPAYPARRLKMDTHDVPGLDRIREDGLPGSNAH